MEHSVGAYIKNNWKNVVRSGKSEWGIDLPYPHTVPCMDERFVCFFYWDTYFTNLGLLIDDIEQALNNINVMKFFVEKMGFIPNGNHRLMFNRSQPPLYPHAVMDYYSRTKDISVIRNHYDSMKAEYDFWMKNRITEIGLNQYGARPSKEEIDEFYWQLKERGIVLLEDDDEAVKHYLSEAESGWDFSPRYDGKANYFVQVDLNSILCKTEQILSESASLLGVREDEERYTLAFKKRKTLIKRYLMDESGIFHDYDFVHKKCSSFVCAAGMLPFTMGISNNKVACLNTLKQLEFEYGVSAGAKIETNLPFQWAYPNMWPPLVYWVYKALDNLELMVDANRIREKYIYTLTRNFERTGKLWEKYNCETGEISHSEYTSPPMMGWTAGVYRYFEELQ